MRLIILILVICGFRARMPVIAILANPFPENSQNILSSRVNMQYVRWLEQSRADVVVIQPWYNEETIDEILIKVNGVLWQGGDRDLIMNGQFENTARYILNKLMAIYDNENKSVPLWGTCQGFELLHALIADTTNVLEKFNAEEYTTPLIFNRLKIISSKMFQDMTKKDLNDIKTKNVTSEFHQLGISLNSYMNYQKLNDFLRISTLGKDKDGKLYVASVEAKKYPVYAIQFHPEMVQFTKDDRPGVADSPEAIKLAQNLSTFFIREAKKNSNYMTDKEMVKYDYLNTFEKTPIKQEDYYYYLFDKITNK
jgi:gamma-glutamyl hydrolase